MAGAAGDDRGIGTAHESRGGAGRLAGGTRDSASGERGASSTTSPTTPAVRELFSPATGQLALHIVAHFDVATYDEGECLLHALEEVAEPATLISPNPLLRLAQEPKNRMTLAKHRNSSNMRTVARIIRTYVYERRRAAGMGWREAIITGSTDRDHRLLVDLVTEYGSDHERKRIHALKMRGKLGMRGRDVCASVSEARREACLNSAPRYYRQQ